MYKTMTHLQYPTHCVHVAHNTNTGMIQCFKYNKNACDIAEFDPLDLSDMADYMITPIPLFKYGFVEDNPGE